MSSDLLKLITTSIGTRHVVKSCPFCGSEAVLNDYGTKTLWSISCEGCRVSFPIVEDVGRAVDMWNRRVYGLSDKKKP